MTDHDDDRGNRAPRAHEAPPAKLDAFDGALRALDGMPGVVKTKPTTSRCCHPFLGNAQTFITQTYRSAERGDTIFIEYVGAEGSFRLAIPPEVADTISRQRDALSTKNRRVAGKASAEDRKARGILPGFLRGKGGVK